MKILGPVSDSFLPMICGLQSPFQTEEFSPLNHLFCTDRSILDSSPRLLALAGIRSRREVFLRPSFPAKYWGSIHKTKRKQGPVRRNINREAVHRKPARSSEQISPVLSSKSSLGHIPYIPVHENRSERVDKENDFPKESSIL